MGMRLESHAFGGEVRLPGGGGPSEVPMEWPPFKSSSWSDNRTPNAGGEQNRSWHRWRQVMAHTFRVVSVPSQSGDHPTGQAQVGPVADRGFGWCRAHGSDRRLSGGADGFLWPKELRNSRKMLVGSFLGGDLSVRWSQTNEVSKVAEVACLPDSLFCSLKDCCLKCCLKWEENVMSILSSYVRGKAIRYTVTPA